jgi:hypothetical protein
MVFLGETGGEREIVRTRLAWSVVTGRHAFLNSPIFYVIHYILSSGGFTASSFRASRKVPSTSTTWTDMCVVQVSTNRRPVSYAHVIYVTCYFCDMLSLGSSSGSTGSVRIYRSACKRYTPNIYRCLPTYGVEVGVQMVFPSNPVYVRRVDPSDLVFSLSSHRKHRHSCIGKQVLLIVPVGSV